jgi:hypothetical protein
MVFCPLSFIFFYFFAWILAEMPGHGKRILGAGSIGEGRPGLSGG